MLGAISASSQAQQYSAPSSSDNAAQEAALEKQIQALKDQAKAAQDQVDAAKQQQDIAALQAKLDALKAADAAKAADKAAKADQGQSTPSAAALRQAEFDGEKTTPSNAFWM
ncbi:hypothetical protein [Mesorhizobium sp. INR15]|uniref:hypothetical protein n=1 Tax=Mesorhizobium sp. INR15 TaxID=2654248 RepID=UPI001896770D|nr:hypothetical protein [Mesorhizobium sp. INR15]QPC93516.1 hypothetical protein GA829_24700 [Mesorhizobium sp. INR15]